MDIDRNTGTSGGLAGGIGEVVKNVAEGITAKVKQKYGMVDLKKVPDHANYAKVEKYLRSVGVEITRRMFINYLNDALLPGGHEVKNSNYSYYTREQVITYILVDMFKPILPLSKVRDLLNGILRPVIQEIGLDAAFTTMYEIIVNMAGKFEDAVTAAVAEENLDIVKVRKAQYDIGHYTNLVTLCMAKGALDFYRFSPYALVE